MTMKIFGWMHKKLHLGSTEYNRVAHINSPDILFGDEANEKKDTLLAASERPEDDTDALLLPHMLLTIGTFGHSNPLQHQQISHEEQKNHEELEQVSMFIAKTTSATIVKPGLVIGELETMDIVNKQEEMVEEVMMSKEPLLKEEKDEKRTTLADLLAAEPVSTNNRALPNDDLLATDKRKIASSKKINVPNKIKKGKDQQSPVSTNATKKIHKLITKMLKKKIHPDVARAGQEHHGRREGTSTSDGGEGAIKVDLRFLPEMLEE